MSDSTHFRTANHQPKRTPSTLLKSIVTTRGHQKNVPNVTTSSSSKPKSNRDTEQKTPLGELAHNQVAVGPSPQRMPDTDDKLCQAGGLRGLHKKSKSAVSLASLAPKYSSKEDRYRSRSRSRADKEKTPKKLKSTTNLVALLSRTRPSKNPTNEIDNQDTQDKENSRPPQSNEAPPPIWAQFATTTTSQPTSPRRSPRDRFEIVEDEISRYTPTSYSSSRQNNFDDHRAPTLRPAKQVPISRPLSQYLPDRLATSSFKDVVRGQIGKSSAGSPRPSAKTGEISDQAKSSRRDESSSSASTEFPRSDRRMDAGTRSAKANTGGSKGLTLAQRGSRVMAAVAAFNGRIKESEKSSTASAEEIENAFEALLDSRNIPHNMRDKMRSLDIHIKADFINHDRLENQSGMVGSTSSSRAPSKRAVQRTHRNSTEAIVKKIEDSSANSVEQPVTPSPSKRSRPRSRTFTFSKGDKGNKDESSPTKKQKADGKAAGLIKSSSKLSLVSTSGVIPAADVVGAGRSAVPEDYVVYLQKVRKPENVEVGRMHKLRLVLRNERVAWVDSFIVLGGMTEIVGLLGRIMEVEWREEHEDALLHEVLLCLKALCTTSLAQQKLHDIQTTLFPSLLGMLFDEERKGPSEFTTRGIITSLLYSYLSNALPGELAPRARTLLSYLRDPSPKDDAQPLKFIVSMHQPRPYRVWCKELVDVTKEVFWIFLHPLNIIANPPSELQPGSTTYASIHFPKERPPVPAAPYVGGVEWDATNYLASHLDLLNAIIASLSTIEERNLLRYELKVSGFERSMGMSLRTCKEKFYGAVHAGLRTWVAASHADGWDVKDVRMGPPAEENRSVKNSPKKKQEERKEFAERVALPKLELGLGSSEAGTAWI